MDTSPEGDNITASVVIICSRYMLDSSIQLSYVTLATALPESEIVSILNRHIIKLLVGNIIQHLPHNRVYIIQFTQEVSESPQQLTNHH